MNKFFPMLIGTLMLATFSSSTIASEFEEGRHFHAVGSPVSPPDDRVEVIEAFAYPCPACRSFLPIINRWAEELPDNVTLSHLPVGLQPGWEVFARVYYTADVLGLGKEAHEAMFVALHDERRQFRSIEDIAEVYTAFDVDAEEFVSTSQSFAVDGRMRRNRNEIMRFGVRGTPSMIVQGKWRLSPTDFNSYEQMLAAVDYLIERELAALEPATNGNAGAE